MLDWIDSLISRRWEFEADRYAAEMLGTSLP
jgi:Zn-dependent protease with chaperone function